MRKFLLVWLGMAAALLVQAALPNRPDLGNPRLVVLANNLQNYYYYYEESSRPDYNTDAGRAEKTRKIVDMMVASGADIFAFCEVEAKPIILTLPLRREAYESQTMFPFFDGLIPEGWLLDIATDSWKINPRDRMELLLTCCRDCIGAVSVERISEEEL